MFPKQEKLQKAELEAFEYLFQSIEQLNNKIERLDQRISEIVESENQ